MVFLANLWSLPGRIEENDTICRCFVFVVEWIPELKRDPCINKAEKLLFCPLVQGHTRRTARAIGPKDTQKGGVRVFRILFCAFSAGFRRVDNRPGPATGWRSWIRARVRAGARCAPIIGPWEGREGRESPNRKHAIFSKSSN